MSKVANQFFENLELIKTVKADIPDCVDKLLEKNGVLYNSPEDLDYQEEHEGSFDYSIGRGEDDE